MADHSSKTIKTSYVKEIKENRKRVFTKVWMFCRHCRFYILWREAWTKPDEIHFLMMKERYQDPNVNCVEDDV